MRWQCWMAAVAACLVVLAGCGAAEPEVPAATFPVETAVPETTAPETTVPETMAPEHSGLYIPGIRVEDVILWFNEVCLDAEYYTEGHPELLQKWTEPIAYRVEGSPTEADLEQLADFAGWLNSVEGFPGMVQADRSREANWRIYFCDAAEMRRRMGDTFVDMDGAVTFWYNGEDEIYEAITCYRTDLSQELRNSVILEEIYNGLGPVQDSELRSDSIISAEFGQPEALTEMDELIIRLLYHPDMKCGMDMAQCEAVIRQLYR